MTTFYLLILTIGYHRTPVETFDTFRECSDAGRALVEAARDDGEEYPAFLCEVHHG